MFSRSTHSLAPLVHVPFGNRSQSPSEDPFATTPGDADSVHATRVNDLTLRRLERAWACVTANYLEKAKKDSLDHGKGVSYFCFLRPSPTLEPTPNCHYYFLHSENETYADHLGDRVKMLDKLYRPGNFIVSVTVPSLSEGEEYGTIKMFSEECTLIAVLDDCEAEPTS